jgi:PEP-CTERM motif
LLDWKNAAVYPQNTPNNIGGIDIKSGSGFIVKAVPEPSSIPALIIIGLGLFSYARANESYCRFSQMKESASYRKNPTSRTGIHGRGNSYSIVFL